MFLRPLILAVCILTQLIVAVAPSCAGYFAYKNLGLHAQPEVDQQDGFSDQSVKSERRRLTARGWRLPDAPISAPECRVLSIAAFTSPLLRPTAISVPFRTDAEPRVAHQRETLRQLTVLLI
jgi:hypothetical protein